MDSSQVYCMHESSWVSKSFIIPLSLSRSQVSESQSWNFRSGFRFYTRTNTSFP